MFSLQLARPPAIFNQFLWAEFQMEFGHASDVSLVQRGPAGGAGEMLQKQGGGEVMEPG